MTDVGRWRVGILLFSSMAGAAIASADRMNFPDDPQAYEPPTKARSSPVTGPFAPDDDSQGLRRAEHPMVTPPMMEVPNTSGANAQTIPSSEPWVKENPKPATADDHWGARPSKPSLAVPPPSERIVKLQSHAFSPAPPKSVVVVGITGGILLIGFLIKRVAGRERLRENAVQREPVLVTGVGGASTSDLGPPDYLRFFELDATAREEDVLRAYRERSWTVHPDHGGDPAAFKEMQRRFEQSLAFVRRRRGPVSLP